MEKLLSKKNVPKPHKDEFDQVMKYFRADIEKLSGLIEMDLQK